MVGGRFNSYDKTTDNLNSCNISFHKNPERERTRPNNYKKPSGNYEEFKEVLNTLYSVARLSGYKITNRIILEDLKTGKIWD